MFNLGTSRKEQKENYSTKNQPARGFPAEVHDDPDDPKPLS